MARRKQVCRLGPQRSNLRAARHTGHEAFEGARKETGFGTTRFTPGDVAAHAKSLPSCYCTPTEANGLRVGWPAVLQRQRWGPLPIRWEVERHACQTWNAAAAWPLRAFSLYAGAPRCGKRLSGSRFSNVRRRESQAILHQHVYRSPCCAPLLHNM